jgi:PEP-CTERM motif
MTRIVGRALGTLLAGALLAVAGSALAAPVPFVCPWIAGSTTGNDLTTAGASTNIGGAIYESADSSGSVGTGDFPAFVKINGNADCVSGYNTDGTLEFDTNNAPIIMFTLDTMNVVSGPDGTGSYVEFILDINQTKENPLLSLDNVQIYVSASSTLTGLDASACTLAGVGCVYNMDGGSNEAILLNYTLNNGSGNGFDMSLFVPTSVFSTVSDPSKTFVYLYSEFGGVGGLYKENDGAEEWAYNRCPAGQTCLTIPPQQVPEPATVGLIALAMLACVAVVRRRNTASMR